MSLRWRLRRLRRRRVVRNGFGAAVVTLGTVLSTTYDRLQSGLQVAALVTMGASAAAAVLLLESPPEARLERPGSGPHRAKPRPVQGGKDRAERRSKVGWGIASQLRLWPSRRAVPVLSPRDELFRGRVNELRLLKEEHNKARRDRTVVARSPLRRAGRTTSEATGPVILLVHGKPGVGKTAIADELGRQLAGAYPDGQVFVNMGTAGAARTPNEILKEFLLSLGWSEHEMPATTVERARIFRSLTARKRLLFILDAARHADQVRHVLPSDPATGVLVTSRRNLMLTDPLPVVSYLLDVPDEDEALSIFRAVSHTSDGARPECAAEVVHLCGRLPMAIRSAGERVFVDGTDICQVAGLLRSPRSRLEWLDQPGRPLRAHIETECRRLLPDEQRALAMLALVPSATFVPWVLRPLMDISVMQAEALVDRLAVAQLLDDLGPDEQSGVARYRFHPLIKLFAGEVAARLPEDERTSARNRLDLAYREVASEVLHILDDTLLERWEPVWLPAESTLPKQIAVRPEKWVRAEYPNLLRVMSLPRGVEQAAGAGSNDGQPSTALCWRLGRMLGDCVAPDVSHDDALDAFSLALRAAEEERDELAVADVLLAKGTFLTAVERYRGAEQCFTRAASTATASAEAGGGDRAAEAAWQRVVKANRKLGEAYLQAACYRRAREYLDKALLLAEATMDTSELGRIRILIADSHHVDALEATYERLHDLRLTDSTRFRVFLSLAEAGRRRGEWHSARDYLHRALRFVDGDLRRTAAVHYRLARLLLDERDDLEATGADVVEVDEAGRSAVRQAAAAAVTFHRMENPIGLVRAHVLLTRTALAIGRVVEAEHLARTTAGEYLSLLDSDEPPDVLLAIAARLKRAEGELRLASGDLYGGRQVMMEAATALRENQDWAVLEHVLGTFEDRDDDRREALGADRGSLVETQPGRTRPQLALAAATAARSPSFIDGPSESLAARVSGAVASRVQAEIRRALLPPPAVTFRGGIDARLTGATSDTSDTTTSPVWRVPIGQACHLTVLVTTGDRAFADARRRSPTGAAVSLPFNVAEGSSATHTDVTVSVDAPFLQLTRPRLVTSCRTEGGTVRLRGSLLVPEAGRYSLRISLLSAGRLVQILPIELATE